MVLPTISYGANLPGSMYLNNVAHHTNKHVLWITKKNDFLLDALPAGNMIIITQLAECFIKNAITEFSLKIAVQGTVQFRFPGKEISVQKNEMLLAAEQPGVHGFIDSESEATYISINISEETLDEAFHHMLNEQGENISNDFRQFFRSPSFFDRVSQIQELPYSGLITQLIKATWSDDGCLYFIDRNWFLELASAILKDEYFTYSALNNLESIKKISTRNDLLLRLRDGKRYIDMNYLANPEISKVASYCNLSVFHFFRSFKQAFQLTPYQYIMQKRLEHALSLMALNKHSLTEVALSCAFPDIFTFSKAFKRQFNCPPSRHIKVTAA